MKRLLYFLLIIPFFYGCEKTEDNFTIVGDWDLYGITLQEVAIDTAASNSITNALKSIINTIHATEDSTASKRKISIGLTSDNRYTRNGEEIGSYNFRNNRLTISETRGETIIYDSIFLNKDFLSYTVDRTSLFTDSIFLRDNGLSDTISPNLLQKVLTRYSYKRP